MYSKTSNIPTDLAHFATRSDRANYLVDKFGKLLVGNVLDVGCDMRLLRKLLPPEVAYTGIDIGGDPDIQIDLEKIDRLPFDDAAFECVVCTDVLEHIDNLHHVFAELARVSSRYIIISLPNNWVNARLPVARGRGHIGFYGLPVNKPVDRHKWFFSLSEAREFFEGQADSMSLNIVEMLAVDKPRPPVLRSLLRLFTPSKERYLNRYAHTLWAIFEKKTAV